MMAGDDLIKLFILMVSLKQKYVMSTYKFRVNINGQCNGCKNTIVERGEGLGRESVLLFADDSITGVSE